MKQAEIQIGGLYDAKVSGRVVPLRILEALASTPGRNSRYLAVNTTTNRQLKVTAARLRGVTKPKRCGACSNCEELKRLRLIWEEKYRAAVDLGQEQMLTIRNEWRDQVAKLPCPVSMGAIR